MSKIPIAVQLYTLRDETARDFAGTLHKVAQFGYAGVEFAGFGGLSAGEVKGLLDDLQLRPAGAHVAIEALEQELASVIDFQLAIGNRYIVCPWMPEERRGDAAGWRQAAQALAAIGAECARHGLVLCYHNHDFEFARFDGESGLDLLYGAAPARDLQAELDLYWVKKGGEDPVAYINMLSGRLPLLHLKDMADDPERGFSEVGNGILDWPAIFAAAQAAGVQWYIVEQDTCQRPPLESVEISLRNLQSWGMA